MVKIICPLGPPELPWEFHKVIGRGISGAVLISSGAFVPKIGLINNQKKADPKKLYLRETEAGQDPTGGQICGLPLTPAVLVPGFLSLSAHVHVSGVLNSSLPVLIYCKLHFSLEATQIFTQPVAVSGRSNTEAVE